MLQQRFAVHLADVLLSFNALPPACYSFLSRCLVIFIIVTRSEQWQGGGQWSNNDSSTHLPRSTPMLRQVEQCEWCFHLLYSTSLSSNYTTLGFLHSDWPIPIAYVRIQFRAVVTTLECVEVESLHTIRSLDDCFIEIIIPLICISDHYRLIIE